MRPAFFRGSLLTLFSSLKRGTNSQKLECSFSQHGRGALLHRFNSSIFIIVAEGFTNSITLLIMKWSFVEKLLCLSAIVHVEARVGGGSLQSTGINNEDGSNAVSTKEDAVFWDRILQESHGSMIQSPTDAPVPAPTANAATPAPVPSPTTSPVSAPVTSPTNVPTPGPTSEPVTPAPTPTPATPAPVPNPTASPVSLPVPSPTNVPTPLTSEPATSAPTPSPTEAVVETGSPTVSPTASVIDATSAPTSAPVAVPTATATTGAPTFFMPGTDPPKPGLCPMRVFTSCATLEGNIPCLQYPIPDDPTSEDCIARVEYTYNMTNFGNDTRRVYSLSVLRNNELTIVLSRPPEVPIILVEPGESFIAKSPSVVVLDVCTEKGIDIFDSKVDITGGFPVTSEVRSSDNIGYLYIV